jgi:hypothetical protein
VVSGEWLVLSEVCFVSLTTNHSPLTTKSRVESDVLRVGRRAAGLVVFVELMLMSASLSRNVQNFKFSKYACAKQSHSAQVRNDSAQVKNDSARLRNDSAQMQNDSAQMQNDSALVQNDSASVQDNFALVQNDAAPAQNNSAQVRSHSAPVRNQ